MQKRALPAYSSLARRLIHSKEVPTGSEEHELRSIVAAAKETLASLDAEIRDLHSQRDLVAQFIDTHRIIVHPIRRLPTELLRLIFITAIDQTPIQVPLVHDVLPLAFTFTWVCSRWRAIALTMPQLWSNIHINEERARRFPPVTLLPALLDRCCDSVPISLLFEGTYYPNHKVQVLPLLLDHPAQWGSLSLYLKTSTSAFTAQIRARIQRLSTLELHWSSYSAGPDASISEWIEHAPALRHLTMYGVHPKAIQAPWSQLTTVAFHDVPNPGILCSDELDLLRRLPNLTSYTMMSINRDSPVDGDLDNVLLPKLEELNVGGNVQSPLLGLIIAPQLCKLTVKLGQDCGSPLSLIQLIQRSSCRIEALSVEVRSGGDEHLIELLGATLLVTAFTLWIHDDDGRHTVPHLPTAFPNLRRFRLVAWPPRLRLALFKSFIQEAQPPIAEFELVLLQAMGESGSAMGGEENSQVVKDFEELRRIRQTDFRIVRRRVVTAKTFNLHAYEHE